MTPEFFCSLNDSDRCVPGRRMVSRLLLASLLMMSVGCQQEIAKWEYAAGLNHYDQGDLDASIECLQSALKRMPDDEPLRFRTALVLAENDQGDLGIALCNDFLEKYPNHRGARRIRAVCLQYLGRFKESLADYQVGIADHVEKSPGELNNLAYFRALANEELPKAARQIDDAISSEESNSWGCRYLVPLPVRAVVATGLVSRHQHTQDIVMDQLNQKIQDYEQRWRRQSGLLSRLVTEMARQQFPLNPNQIRQTSSARANQEVVRVSLGLMLATRCLMNEDFGKVDQVDDDRRLIQELGGDFSDFAADLPPIENCLKVLEDCALYLDTRGFVLARLPWQSEELQRWADQLEMNHVGLLSSYQAALTDLNLAILAAQINHLAIHSNLYNRSELSLDYVESRRHNSRRMTAVLLYHRMEAHQKAGQTELADLDRQSIIGMGLEPDASLF